MRQILRRRDHEDISDINLHAVVSGSISVVLDVIVFQAAACYDLHVLVLACCGDRIQKVTVDYSRSSRIGELVYVQGSNLVGTACSNISFCNQFCRLFQLCQRVRLGSRPANLGSRDRRRVVKVWLWSGLLKDL